MRINNLLLATFAALSIVGCNDAPQVVQAACQDFCGPKVFDGENLWFEVKSLSFHHGRWYCTCQLTDVPLVTAFDEQGARR